MYNNGGNYCYLKSENISLYYNTHQKQILEKRITPSESIAILSREVKQS
jgi:hypothetical protein